MFLFNYDVTVLITVFLLLFVILVIILLLLLFSYVVVVDLACVGCLFVCLFVCSTTYLWCINCNLLLLSL